MGRSGFARALLDPTLLLALLIAAAVTAGGGGVSAAFGNLAVQLFALLILGLHPGAVGAFARRGPRALVVLTGVSCVFPLLQLIPLPPALWNGLPGRDLVVESLDLAGERGWFPLSVAPGRTLSAFLGLIAPFTVIVLGCGLAPDRLVKLQRLVIALCLATALFGTTHLLNDRWGDLYASQQMLPGVIVGTFADRNAAALFFLAGLLMLIGLPLATRLGVSAAVQLAGGAFLALCVVLTGSRTGMVLLGAPLILLGWRFAASLMRGGGRASPSRIPVLWTLAGVLALVLAGAVVAGSGRGQASLSRFDSDDGMRAQMREDARFAAARYWPVGAGMGTFDEVFQVDESLEYVSPRRAGRAHMDYLELAIEGGLAALILAGAWLAWASWYGWVAVRRPAAWPARAAALVLATVAAQSLLSFPLRNQAMLCVAALAAVLLVRSPVAAPSQAEPESGQ